jgi:hypothetical protein
MSDFKKEFRTSEKEKFQEHKQLMLEKVEKLIDNGGPFMIVGENNDEGVVAMGGSPQRLAEVLAKSMAKLDDLYEIVELAQEALMYATKKATAKDEPTMFDVTDKLGCETCPKRDTCKIYNLAASDEGQNLGEFVDELRKQHPEVAKMISSKSKGDC